MSMVPINWQPDRKTLAEFSEFGMFFLGMVACPLAYFRGHSAVAAVFWLLAVIGRVIGLWRPALLKSVYIGLTLATWPIGWVVSHLTLALVYYGVMTPIGFLLRRSKRDPLTRSFDRESPTYWEPYNPNRGMSRYLRQF